MAKARKAATAKLGSVKNPAMAGAGKVPAEEVWEVRPGGLLVQRWGAASDEEPVSAKPVPNIRMKVKHAGVSHEIYISSQATFGELKKEVAARTGMHLPDQKLLFKDKERDGAAFLDTCALRRKGG